MANITDKINNIRTAIFGKEVRGSLADGLDAVNKETERTTSKQEHLESTFNQLVINSGTSNAEVVDARVKQDGTSFNKLGDRIDSIDSQMDDIPNQPYITEKAKEVDLNTTNIKVLNLENTKASKDDVARISTGTPLFASSIGDMTDIKRNYVNTTDGYLYRYNGSIFEKTTVLYQSSGISDKSILLSNLNNSTISGQCLNAHIKTKDTNDNNIYITSLYDLNSYTVNNTKGVSYEFEMYCDKQFTSIKAKLYLSNSNDINNLGEFLQIDTLTLNNNISNSVTLINGKINTQFYNTGYRYLFVILQLGTTSMTNYFDILIDNVSLEIGNVSLTPYINLTPRLATTESYVKLSDNKNSLVTIEKLNQKIEDLKSMYSDNVAFNITNGLFDFKTSLLDRNEKKVNVVVIGDSITQGYRAGNFIENAYSSVLRNLLQSAYGGSEKGFQTALDEERWVGQWESGFFGVAKGVKYSNVAGAKLVFDFYGDSVDIHHITGSDTNIFGIGEIKVDGVKKGDLNCIGSLNNNAITTISNLELTNHKLEVVVPIGGKRVYCSGINPRISNETKGIVVHRCGCNGSRTPGWIDVKGILEPTLSFNPNLTIIALSTNDAEFLTPYNEFKENYKIIIREAKKYGSVCLLPMMWGDLSVKPDYSRIPKLVDIMYELALEENVALIDIFKVFGNTQIKNNFTECVNNGLMGVANTGQGESGNDYVHPSKKGHELIATTIFNHIRQ